MMGFFTDALKFAEECEKAPFRIATARIEASRFIGEDGKEYIRLEMPKRFLCDPSKEAV